LREKAKKKFSSEEKSQAEKAGSRAMERPWDFEKIRGAKGQG